MTYEAIDGAPSGASKPSPAVTIEGVSSPGDLDLISSDASITIVGDDVANTIDLKAAAGGGLPAVDTTPVVKGSADATKLVRIEADGLTTGTTRVLTMPDADITPDDASASRTPLAHKDTHKSGGTDALAAGDTLESASRTVRVALRNETGSLIPKGTLVAVSGFSVPEGRPIVVVADKDDAANRPAAAVTEAAVANNTNFEGLVLGLLTGLNTSAFSENDQLVLGDAGAVSRPPPDVDPFTGEIQLIGSTFRIDASNGSIYFTLSSGLLPMTAAQFFATKEITPTGNVSGGEVTRVSGLNVAVAAGSGFVNDGTEVFRVIWSADPSLALTASDTNFIFVDKNGLVQASTSPPDLENNISLGDAITDGSTVLLLANHQVLLTEHLAKSHLYRSEVIGNVTVSGLVTSQATAALRVKVDSGTFYTRDFRVTVPATNPVTFTYWFRDGSGGFTRAAGSTLIDKDNFDDGSGTLAALIGGEFKKDLLFVVFTASGLVEYHVFYGQEKFTSQALAEGGNLPAADSDVIANGIRSAGIVQEGAAAAIASFVDVRPFLGQLAPPVTSVSDHGLLSGLADDDHTQYTLADGTRAFSGDVDMGANAITNVGNVDGVDVSAHAPRHTNGSDDIQNATAAQKGLATASQITKLDGIEALAEVNDVNSVFGRTAAVVASASDYDASQVDNDSNVAGAFVDDALNALDQGTGLATVSAATTQTQAAGTLLTARTNYVGTVLNDGDAVKLKDAVAGDVQVVENDTDQVLQIFPNTSDAIEAVAVDASISIGPRRTVSFRAKDATTWITDIPMKEASFFIEGPSASEDLTSKILEGPIRIFKMAALITGGGTDIDWTARFNADRTAGGTEVVASGTTTSQKTTPQVITTLTNVAVPRGNVLWIETTDKTGNITSLFVVIFYKEM